jgi:hypothetical protein
MHKRRVAPRRAPLTSSAPKCLRRNRRGAARSDHAVAPCSVRGADRECPFRRSKQKQRARHSAPSRTSCRPSDGCPGARRGLGRESELMRSEVVVVPPRASRHRLTTELFAARPGQRVKPPKGGGARPAGMNPTRDAIPPRGSNPDWASSLACRSSELIQRRAGLPRASRTGARMPVAPDPSTTVG